MIALSETTRDQVVQSITLFLSSLVYRVLIVSYEVRACLHVLCLFRPSTRDGWRLLVTSTVFWELRPICPLSPPTLVLYSSPRGRQQASR